MNKILTLSVIFILSVLLASCKKTDDSQEACFNKWLETPEAYLPECGGCYQNYTAVNNVCYQASPSNLDILEMPSECLDNIVIWNKGINVWLISDYDTGDRLGTLTFGQKLDDNYYSDIRFRMDSDCEEELFYLMFMFTREEWIKANTSGVEARGKIYWIYDSAEDQGPFREDVVIVRPFND